MVDGYLLCCYLTLRHVCSGKSFVLKNVTYSVFFLSAKSAVEWTFSPQAETRRQKHFLITAVIELRKSNEISNGGNVHAGNYRCGKCSDLIIGYGCHLANIEAKNKISIL